MSTASTSEQRIHVGHNIKRYREMFRIKQLSMAKDLGPDWTQKKVSRLEEKEVIDKELLEQVAKILNIPMEKLENQDAEQEVVNIQNNYEGSNPGATNIASSQTYENCTINPLDKIVELYERLLAVEKEKNYLLQQLLDKQK